MLIVENPTPPPTLSEWKARTAARYLRSGGIIAYPTEAVYGLGCDPLNKEAVARLLALKNRPQAKGFILIASRLEQIESWVKFEDGKSRKRVLATWPGPVTWVLPAHQWIPEWLRTNDATLAVRVTKHPISAALCEVFGGPLVSTSANKSGELPARNPLQIRKRFPGSSLMIIHGATIGAGKPTPIFHALTGQRLR